MWVDFKWSYYVPLPSDREGWISPAELDPQQAERALSLGYHRGWPPHPTLSVRRYPVVIQRVKELLETNPLRGKRVALLVDKTGVGAPIVDALAQAGMRPIAISIHGGSAVSRDRGGYRVPKRDLVSATQVLLQGGRLKISGSLKEAETLRKELLNFRVKIDPKTAHDSYEHWREGDHDDLVLATAMACWFRQWWNRSIDLAEARVEARDEGLRERRKAITERS